MRERRPAGGNDCEESSLGYFPRDAEAFETTSMVTLGERSFHLLMAVAFTASLGVDPLMKSIVPTWSPPAVGLLTLVLGLAWVALFAGHRVRKMEAKHRVLEDRLERTERRVQAIDAELAERRRPLL